MTRDYDAIFRKVEQLAHKYMQVEQKKRCYGLDFPLTCVEIHIIDEIGRNPGIGVKGIARNKVVTEGAVSQMVKKLIGKNLINKQISKESESKVELSLTEYGQICFDEHNEFHVQANMKWYALFDQMEEQEIQRLSELLAQVDKIMEV